jgi:hypothetical protein
MLLELAKIDGWDLGDPDDVSDLLESATDIGKLSDKQKLQSIVCLLGDAAFTEGETVDDMLSEFRCLHCWKPGQVESAILYLLCQIIPGVTPN